MQKTIVLILIYFFTASCFAQAPGSCFLSLTKTVSWKKVSATDRVVNYHSSKAGLNAELKVEKVPVDAYAKDTLNYLHELQGEGSVRLDFNGFRIYGKEEKTAGYTERFAFFSGDGTIVRIVFYTVSAATPLAGDIEKFRGLRTDLLGAYTSHVNQCRAGQ